MADPEAWGVDVGHKAWAVVRLGAAGIPPRARVVPFEALTLPRGALAIVDVPLGLLPDARGAPTPKGTSGDREVDKGARKWCPSASSVFPPPTRGQLRTAVAEHRRAARAGVRAELARVSPGGLSRQTFELVPAMEAARRLAGSAPGQVFEGHPEVAFSALAGGVLAAPKLSLIGALARAAVIRARLGFDVTRWALQVETETGVASDNWLDALVLAVAASDWLRGVRRILRTRDGHVHGFGGEDGGLVALPETKRVEPPVRLDRAETLALAVRGP